MIYTVGYQCLQGVQGLADVVKALKVSRVVDVRSVPSSRKPGFSRGALQASLGGLYLWAGDTLGGRGRGPTVAGLRMLAEASGGGRRGRPRKGGRGATCS